jgi:NAD(P) transhydrogenase subunit alpha
MMTTEAGTIRPATVVVLGAGVAGLQAIATARRLSAIVKAFDVRSAAAEQVESLGVTFEPQDAQTAGGYSQQLSPEEIAKLIEGLQPFLHDADAVITTAAIPGRRAPVLVTADTVHHMKKGAVIVDGAAATGGNCELSVADEEVVVSGVTILAPTDLPSRVATHASQMFARNAYELLTHITSTDELDFDDEIVAGVTITHDGKVVHGRVQSMMEAGV